MRFTLGLLMLVPAFAQTSPDAAELLARSGQDLLRYHSYQLTQDMTMNIQMPGMSMPAIKYTMVTQVVNPDKVRMEMNMGGVGPFMLVVSSGADTWMYMQALKQYSRMPSDNSGDLSSLMLGGMGMATGPAMKERAANAKVLRSEFLEVDGQQRDCWVVETRPQSDAVAEKTGPQTQDAVYTFWIDKILGLQLKTSVSGKTKAGTTGPATETSMMTTTRSMKFNEALPDSLFVFTPPEGAKETKELFPGMGAIGVDTSAVSSKQAAPVTKAASKPQPGEPEAFIPMLNPIDRIEPVYPPEASSQGLQGMVELLVTIDTSGAVLNVEPLTGRDQLRPAASDAVKQWRFRPVYRDGHPVVAYTQAMVHFYLKSEKPLSAEDLGAGLGEQMQSTQRIQKLTQRFPRSPEQVLADSEDQMRELAGEMRFYDLTALPKQALDAGELEKASSYANELLQSASVYTKDWNYGNAVYDANMVLGQVALRQNRVSEARHYLLESAKTPGSPQLGSFGPDFTLARELLQKGERDAVVEFLTLTKVFWKMGADRLDTMIAEVRGGGTF